ncbi:unnamed protein product [Owenia fusiformis]|uniref:Uncharacterized protein n=1 Tax=Owenia fusiformis TaxID=6347 RepID=A0A8J1XFR3_OWEFU|nr:unnamed protein product [Owenia fusiformis]
MSSSSKELLDVGATEELSCLVIKKKKENEVTPLSERKTFRMENSSVLGQVRSFLPKIAAANDVLQMRINNREIEGFSIEEPVPDDKEGQFIEMKLSMVEQGSDEQDSDSDTDDSINMEEITEHNMKIHKTNNKAKIEELQSNSSTNKDNDVHNDVSFD